MIPPVPGFSLSHVRSLSGCSHYHQAPDRQPGGNLLGPGVEKVELVTAGRGWVAHEGRLVEVVPGALIWHMPGERMICRSDPSDPYSCLSITWQVDPAVPRQVPRFTRWDDRSECLAYTRDIVRACTDGRIDRAALACASYAHLQWRAHLHVATAAGPDLPPALGRLLAALAAEPGRDWPVATMARLAGWSPSRLHAVFAANLATSPHQHLLELRLRVARELLSTGDDGLDDIARRCGLGSAAALCRHFRAATGMTPGEYRERQR